MTSEFGLNGVISLYRERKSICSKVPSSGGEAKGFSHPKMY